MDPFALVGAIRCLSMADVEDLGEGEAEALVAACERAVTAIQARGSLAMDTLAHRVQQRLDAEAEEFAAATGASRTRWMSSSHQVVPSMLAPALRVASRTVLARLEADRYLVNTMATTFEAMWAGDLERHRADAVTECGRGLSGKALERYEDLVLESSVDQETGEVVTMSERVTDMPRATLRRRAARIARDLDPKVTRAWAEQARESRHVRVRGAPDPGMTQWDALLPADVSQRAWAAVDALAASYCRANSGLKVDAARADALADLVLGNSTIATSVELVVPVVPLATVLALSPAPVRAAAGGVTWAIAGMVEHPRVGALLPESVAALLADPAVVVRLARLEADGTLVQDPRTYRPGAVLRRRVRARDRTCRFPGCHTPAARTDLDHVIPFPKGPTDEGNLVCLCRTHHLFKQHGGWRLAVSGDGTLVWTTPDGRSYGTRPGTDQLRHELHSERADAPPGVRDESEGPPPLAHLIVEELAQPPSPPECLTPEAPLDWQILDAPGVPGDPPGLPGDPLSRAGDPPGLRGDPSGEATCHSGHGETGGASTLEQRLAEVVSMAARRRRAESSVDLDFMGGLELTQCG